MAEVLKKITRKSTGPGKFEATTDLGEYLYELSLESGHDDELGDSETFGWYALFDGVEIENENGEQETIYAILKEDSQGFITVDEYDDHEILMEEWNNLQEEYEEFEEEGDDEDDDEEEEYEE